MAPVLVTSLPVAARSSRCFSLGRARKAAIISSAVRIFFVPMEWKVSSPVASKTVNSESTMERRVASSWRATQ